MNVVDAITQLYPKAIFGVHYSVVSPADLADVKTRFPAAAIGPNLIVDFVTVQTADGPVRKVYEAGDVGPLAWDGASLGVRDDAKIAALVAAGPSSADLRAYAAAARFAKEAVGITVGNAPIATDRDSQAMINGMWAAAQINPAITVQFKSAGAGFATITAAQIQAIAAAVIAHVQACFAAEAQVDAAIAAGTITTTAQIDAAFAAVTT